MGGFLLECLQDGAARPSAAALSVFERNGLGPPRVLERPGFVLRVFGKRFPSSDNVLVLPHGDFVVATGTLLYKGQIGSSALQAVYDDHPWDDYDFAGFRGHFCVLLFKRGILYVFNDAHGLYHVYRGNGTTVLSNSFLAVLKSLATRTPSEQEIYEYICHGAMYGDRTMIREIEMLDCQRVHQLAPAGAGLPKRLGVPRFDCSRPLDGLAEEVAQRLIEYFVILKNCFGDSIATALSGGFDSRLIVALLRRVGVRGLVYVYGRPSSRDVRLSEAMAAGEGFSVEHTDKDPLDAVEPERFLEAVRERYYFLDGRGITGVFSGRADVVTRLRNAERARLLLNGGGGEVFRNFWSLPDRSLTIKQFVKARYDFMEPAMFTRRFDLGAHLATMGEKIRFTLQADGERLSRTQVELIYALQRLKYWMGQNNTCNNTLAHALTPFAEPVFALPAASLPLRYKNAGQLEAAVIRHVDARLAQYPSAHGFDFARPIPWKARLQAAGKRHVPISLRPYLRRRSYHSGSNARIGEFLRPRYVDKLLNLASLEISRFVHVDKIRNRDMLNRALTAEIVLTDRL